MLIALCLGRARQALWFAFICTVGSVLGGMLGYGIGRWGGRPLLKTWFSPQRVAPVEAYYERWNAWATGIGGLTPLPYKIFTIAGGVFAVNFKVFVVASIAAEGCASSPSLCSSCVRRDIRSFIEKHLSWLSIAFVILLVSVSGSSDEASDEPQSRDEFRADLGRYGLTADQNEEIMNELKRFIREIPDFPKPGILFYDITTLLQNPIGLRRAVDQFVWLFAEQQVDKVVGIESRGFLFGPVVAYNLNAGFVPVRKPGKLPWETVEQSYELEYGIDSIEMHRTPSSRASGS